MATVGNIKAEVLLKIEGTERTVSVGHIEIPVNVTTDEVRPGQLNVRVNASGVARSVGDVVDGLTIQIDSRRTIGALRNSNNHYTKENY